MTTTLPWFLPKLKEIENLPAISSGCALVSGNINCSAESMRKAAEQKFKALGIAKSFGLDDTISMDEYSAARYGRTEVGSDIASELAVIEAGRNRAKIWGMSMDKLLRLRQPAGHSNRGFYGPIHATEAECTAKGLQKGCAPYGRWAGTKRDPRPVDIIIAKLVISGRSNNYAKGADDQLGPSAGDSLFGREWIYKRIKSLANSNNYWVGLIPGVNHRKTMLFRKMPAVAPGSPEGRKLIANAEEWAHKDPPNWSAIPVGVPPFILIRPRTKKFLALGVGLMGLGSALFLLTREKKAASLISAPPGADYVLYASENCPACMEFKPQFLAMAPPARVHEISLDTDEGMKTAQDDGVRMLPTVIRVRDGKRFEGVSNPRRLLLAS
jgi:hypothetical protein